MNKYDTIIRGMYHDLERRKQWVRILDMCDTAYYNGIYPRVKKKGKWAEVILHDSGEVSYHPLAQFGNKIPLHDRTVKGVEDHYGLFLPNSQWQIFPTADALESALKNLFK